MGGPCRSVVAVVVRSHKVTAELRVVFVGEESALGAARPVTTSVSRLDCLRQPGLDQEVDGVPLLVGEST